MDANALPWSQITAIASIFLGVGSAVGFLTAVSRSTRRASSPPPPPQTRISLQAFEELREEVTSLSLGLEGLRKSVKKLNGYKAVEKFREREASEAPPLGTSKAQLRQHYGLAGKSHREIAILARGVDADMQQE